jgi:hypothetical protein
MRQQNAGLFLDRVDQKAWLFDFERKPDLVCIHGPYINQRIVREVCDNLPQERILLHAGGTTHHDAHWDHPGRRSRISPSEVLKALNSDGEVRDDCRFVRQSDLKIREEKNGYLIAQDNTAYFVNKKGSRLLNLLGHRVRVGDVPMLCRNHGIPAQAGLEFFRRLVTFGLYRPI